MKLRQEPRIEMEESICLADNVADLIAYDEGIAFLEREKLTRGLLLPRRRRIRCVRRRGGCFIHVSPARNVSRRGARHGAARLFLRYKGRDSRRPWRLRRSAFPTRGGYRSDRWS